MLREVRVSWKSRKRVVESVAAALVKAGALQFGTYTLPNGKESSYLITLEDLPSLPGAYRVVFDAFLELVKRDITTRKFEAIAAIPVAGLTFTAPLALALGRPMISLRRDERGSSRRIEGSVQPGWRVLVIDDLIASGETLLASCMRIRQEGADVFDAAVLIDRLEGGRERLAKNRINLHPLTDILELGDVLFARDTIGEYELKAIVRQVGGRVSRP